ncbi:dihydrofolate reductase [bacterium]|jgi:dihydrofolate reductase|nr:dihydrofolate reductase [bacterium]
MISIIAVIDKNKGLAKDGNLLVRLPEDLQHFKKITSGHVVIMGRKTYQSIGGALPDRINIVLSKDPKFKAKDCVVFENLDKALEFAKIKILRHFGNAQCRQDEEIFFIGGGEIYKQVLPLADKLYLTIIDAEYEADTWFPDYSEFNKVIKEEVHETDNLSAKGGVNKYKFIELTK